MTHDHDRDSASLAAPQAQGGDTLHALAGPEVAPPVPVPAFDRRVEVLRADVASGSGLLRQQLLVT